MDSGPILKNAPRPFDLKKTGKYKIRLGDVKSPNNKGTRFKAVALNHKPSQTGARRTTTITPRGSSENAYELQLDDENGEDHNKCTYAGRKQNAEHTYVLTFDDEQRAVQLDCISTVYEFNMISAPWENNAEKLKQQYTQIEPNTALGSLFEKHQHHASGSEEDTMAPESDGPDDNNPFDYRHYLTGIPGAQPESKVPSVVSSPFLAPRTGSVSPRPSVRAYENSPQVRAAMPLKHQPLKNQPRRMPATKPLRQRNPASKAKSAASEEEDNDNDRNGLLIIDSGPSTPMPKKARIAPGKSRSLHAAAEAARSTSTRSAEKEAGSGYEEDNESDDPKHAPTSSAATAGDPSTVRADSVQSDEEIEDLQLPDPVSRPEIARRQSVWEPGDEEELQAALAADDDDDEEPRPAANASTTAIADSESESEEE